MLLGSQKCLVFVVKRYLHTCLQRHLSMESTLNIEGSSARFLLGFTRVPILVNFSPQHHSITPHISVRCGPFCEPSADVYVGDSIISLPPSSGVFLPKCSFQALNFRCHRWGNSPLNPHYLHSVPTVVLIISFFFTFCKTNFFFLKYCFSFFLGLSLCLTFSMPPAEIKTLPSPLCGLDSIQQSPHSPLPWYCHGDTTDPVPLQRQPDLEWQQGPMKKMQNEVECWFGEWPLSSLSLWAVGGKKAWTF